MKRIISISVIAIVLSITGCMLSHHKEDLEQTLEPLDPQKVLDQDDMTWADYHPIPGVNWADPAIKPTERTVRIALVVADFEDQPFVVTLPKHSDIFGNPQINPIERADVATQISGINLRKLITAILLMNIGWNNLMVALACNSTHTAHIQCHKK